MSTPSFRRWRDRLTAGVVTHPQANHFCQAIFTKSKGAEQRGRHCNIETDEAIQLVELLVEVKPLVADEPLGYIHGDDTTYRIAREWLARMERESRRCEPWQLWPKLDWDAIVDFRFVGCKVYHENDDRWGYRLDVRPLYEARWANGSTFTYAPFPWARGGPSSKFTAGDVHWEHKEAETCPS